MRMRTEETAEGIGALIISGDVNEGNDVIQLKQALDREAESSLLGLIVDLSRVATLDSNATGSLISATKRFEDKSGGLAVVAVPGGSPRKVLDAVGIRACDSLGTAIDKLDGLLM